MTYLRTLEMNDVEPMLEWMHDDEIKSFFKRDFNNYTIKECKRFILEAKTDQHNLHLAIADSNCANLKKGGYIGTVSLKNIEYGNKAEPAIVIRKEYRGKGIGSFAIQKMCDIGFNILNFKYIYLYVYESNQSAIITYMHNGFVPFRLYQKHSLSNCESEEDSLIYMYRMRNKN